MQAFRVADRRHRIYDSTGAFLHGGRWRTRGKPVIYAAATYAGALLEVLVHANLGVLPTTHAVVDIHIPDTIDIEVLASAALPDWHHDDLVASRCFGDGWLNECRCAVLLVSSVVLQGRESNVLINPLHPDFHTITYSEPENVIWDPRLFKASR